MATPKPEEWNASLYDFAGRTIRDYVRSKFDPKTDSIIDIGAGWAKYKLLLPEFVMDAVEVWGPNVEGNKLREQYRQVFCEPAQAFVQRGRRYAVAILGDTLEHLTGEDAQFVLEKLIEAGVHCVVAVPYQMPQAECEGNPFEVHLQPDLSDEVMAARFPYMERIGVEGHKAVWVSKKETD